MTDPAPYTPPPAPDYAAPAPTAASYPGKGLGIAGLVVVFFSALIGLILSIIARSQSKRAGFANTPATVGMVLGIVLLVLEIVVAIVYVIWFAPRVAHY